MYVCEAPRLLSQRPHPTNASAALVYVRFRGAPHRIDGKNKQAGRRGFTTSPHRPACLRRHPHRRSACLLAVELLAHDSRDALGYVAGDLLAGSLDHDAHEGLGA